MRTQIPRLLLLVALLLGLQVQPTVTHAAGLVVNSFTYISPSADGECTLREAIMNANANSDTSGGDCAAGSGADTITFSVSGNVQLNSTLPGISDAAGLTIDGSGQTVSIDGDNQFRVFFVNAGAALTLNHVTVKKGATLGGNHGAGIFNAGSLTVTNSNILDNHTPGGHGTGIFSSGPLTVTNSTFYNNNAGNGFGGAIFNNGSAATVSNSTLSTNTARFGAGIYTSGISGTLAVSNSTLFNNGATVTGTGGGGGVYVESGTGTLTNNTFSNNSAFLSQGGGILVLSGTLAVTNNTLSANYATTGGGIYNNGGTITLRNTIVANSSSGANCAGAAVANGGNNIDSGTSCGWASANGSSSNAYLPLGPLANNGGPTMTFALLPDSPAIDGVTFNAPNGAPSTDQRGATRPVGARYDIGSFEYGDLFYRIHLPAIMKQ